MLCSRHRLHRQQRNNQYLPAVRHLHFTQSLEPLQGGGLGSSAVALHGQMRAMGLSSVLCSTCGGTPQCPAEGILEFRRLRPDFIYYSPAMQRQAPQLVHEADVLHGHGLYVGTNYVFGKEARRQGKSLVYHVHGFFEPWILNRSRWKKRLAHWLFEDANFRHARLWRALTSKEADQIRSHGIKAPIVVAPNGLDPAEFPKPADLNAPIETPLIKNLSKSVLRVLFLGRVHPKKGLDLLLPAWAKLSALTKDWQLVIAGPDEQGYLTQVRELARSLGLQDQIVFTGPVTGQSKINLLHSSDLFVLPSYSEGFPVSVLEAMACGLPVIATRACNFPDIAGADAGWECDAVVDSLAEALKMALQASESERWKRGQNGRRLVETHYTWPVIIKTLQEACAAHC
jgi:glycosyltransferase involved in cell wall biosynthesis